MSLLRNLADFFRLNRHLYHYSSNQIRRWQEKNVFRLVSQVRENSPFYRELYEGRDIRSLEDFSKLPGISKSVMMANFDRLNTVGLRLDDVMQFAIEKEMAHDYLGYYQDKYVIGLSSGTSGNKGIYVTPRALTERLPGVFLARGGVRLSDLPLRILFILRVFSQGFADINAPLIHLQYLSSMTVPEEIVAACNRMRTNVLMAPPSLLRQILPLHEQIQAPLRRIITYAEVLDPLEKARFEHAFRAPVVEIYQASEGQIASPCRCGSLHINEDLIYVELLDEHDQPLTDQPGARSSRMLVTNLVNAVQPLLRYEMNDLVELGAPCPCGSHFRVLSRVIGRNDDVLYLRTTDGSLRPVYPDLVSRWIITTDDQIREFLVEQDAPDHLTVTLDLGGETVLVDTARDAATSEDSIQDDDTGVVRSEADRSALDQIIVSRLKSRLEQELMAFGIACTVDIRLQRISLPPGNRKLKRFTSRSRDGQ